MDNMEIKNLFEAREFLSARGFKLPYRIYIPANYDETKAYSLMMLLHGAGERGNDNFLQLKNGICEMFRHAASPVHEAIVVLPQCPAEEQWVNVPAWLECIYSADDMPESMPLEAAYELLCEIRDTYSVDCDRIYITGISMGGFGTWDMLIRHGNTFAAAAPVCGGCDVSKAERLKDIPIMTFHGELDPTVPPTSTRAMYAAIRSLGGTNITYEEIPGAGHCIWDEVYAKESLATWLFSQKRSDRA